MSEQERKDADWCLKLAAMVLRGDVPNESVTIKGLADDLDRFRALLRHAEPAPSPHGQDVEALVAKLRLAEGWLLTGMWKDAKGHTIGEVAGWLDSAVHALRSRPVEPEPVAINDAWLIYATTGDRFAGIKTMTAGQEHPPRWECSPDLPLDEVPTFILNALASPVAPREPEK